MISVAMCTYNGEKYIEEQLLSIINQSYQPDEIIICDDCSTDNTVQKAESILSHWNGSNKILKNEHNLGFKKNFQKAISLCHGDIIFLSDQDDVWNLEKIEIMMQEFQKDSTISLVFHDAELVDEHLQSLQPSFWRILNFDSESFLKQDYTRLLAGNVVQGSAAAFRRNIFEKAYPFPDEAVHDEWLGLVACLFGKIVPLSNQLMKYRQGHNQIGGEERSFKDGTQLWIQNARYSSQKHLVTLKNRFKNLRALQERYPEESVGVFGNVFNQYLRFFKRRVELITHRQGHIRVNSYFRYCVGKKQAIRQSMKDIFSMLLIK